MALRYKTKINSGFTLIELLVVISILGLLSSIIFVSVNSARISARDARRKADMRQIATAIEVFYNNHGYYPDPEVDTVQNVDISIVGGFIPDLVTDGIIISSVASPGGPNSINAQYWYIKEKPGDATNSFIRQNSCGNTTAVAALIFWLEKGQSTEFRPVPNMAGANSICFF